jgi:neurexin
VNPLGRLEVAVGKVLWFVIPNNTFVDPEDGGTDKLRLLFLTSNSLSVAPISWIQLNETTRTLYGMPMDADVGKNSYHLAAVDRGGKLVKGAFDVDVVEGPSSLGAISHEFSVTLDINYREFLFKVDRRIDVASKIAGAFGDSDPGHITVTRISEGSVRYAWTNNTLPAEPCPEADIKALSRRLVNPYTGLPNPDFLASMRPYPVKDVGVTPLGSCTVPERTDEPSGTTAVSEPEPVEIRKGGFMDNSLMFMLIVIAAVVLGLLFLILVIVCIVCCCRSRRTSEKQRRQRDDELSCANKGIPVIFADELADDEELDAAATTKTPATATPDDTPASTLKRRTGPDEDEGKPAVPPPQYPRSDPASRTSTLKSDYKAPLLSSDDDEDDAVVVNGGGGTGDTLPPYRTS